jgi:hypothetical protein
LSLGGIVVGLVHHYRPLDGIQQREVNLAVGQIICEGGEEPRSLAVGPLVPLHQFLSEGQQAINPSNDHWLELLAKQLSIALEYLIDGS